MFPSLSSSHHYRSSAIMLYNRDLRAFQCILRVALGSKVH